MREPLLRKELPEFPDTNKNCQRTLAIIENVGVPYARENVGVPYAIEIGAK